MYFIYYNTVILVQDTQTMEQVYIQADNTAKNQEVSWSSQWAMESTTYFLYINLINYNQSWAGENMVRYVNA